MDLITSKIPALPAEETGACRLAAYLVTQKKELNRILGKLGRSAVRGRSGIWEWRRETDGTVEYRAIYKCEQVDTAQVWGSLYHSSIEYGGGRFPFALADRPMVYISVVDAHGRGYMLRHTAPSSAERLGRWCFVLPVERGGGETEDVVADIFVKGRVEL